MFPVECVARGYLAGSGLAEYLATGDGLRRAAAGRPGRRLRAARAGLHPGHQGGHGRPRRERHRTTRWPPPSAPTSPPSCARTTLAVYRRARDIARERGIVVADTKLELGRDADGRLVLGDEVLTPDSSRFWPADAVAARPAAAVVRQAVRARLAHLAGVRLGPRAPASRRRRCPTRSSSATRAKYVEAYERLTGRTFA